MSQLDETTINITSSSLRNALALSAADRRWIDFLTQTISATWDENNPSRPKTLGYMGSEEFIRLQFEEYLLALLSAVKYHIYLQAPHNQPLPSVDGDPSLDFNPDWVHAWRQSSAFALFAANTDSHLFDIVEPRHPTSGNLSFDDIQRRLALQIQTLHLDEHLASSKELLNKHLVTGQKKVSTAFTNLWADIEALREAQRKRAEAGSAAGPIGSTPSTVADGLSSTRTSTESQVTPTLSTAHASVTAAGQKASAYFSSWSTWASDRRKGWTAPRTTAADGSSTTVSPTGRDQSSVVGVGGRALVARVREKHSWEGRGAGRRGREERGGDGIGRLDA